MKKSDFKEKINKCKKANDYQKMIDDHINYKENCSLNDKQLDTILKKRNKQLKEERIDRVGSINKC